MFYIIAFCTSSRVRNEIYLIFWNSFFAVVSFLGDLYLCANLNELEIGGLIPEIWTQQNVLQVPEI